MHTLHTFDICLFDVGCCGCTFQGLGLIATMNCETPPLQSGGQGGNALLGLHVHIYVLAVPRELPRWGEQLRLCSRAVVVQSRSRAVAPANLAGVSPADGDRQVTFCPTERAGMSQQYCRLQQPCEEI